MSLKTDKTLQKLVRTLWRYQILKQQLHKCDAILGLGSHDLFVPKRAAELYFKKYAPIIIFSGGYGKITKLIWNETEAKKFSDIAIKLGVPKESILIEDRSTTTAENLKNTLVLIKHKVPTLKSIIIVTKPYMERRVYGMFKKQWADKEIFITSPKVDMMSYFQNIGINEDEVISLIVGDVQRVIIFPNKGFSIRQNIPNEVRSAMKELKRMGYNKHLLKG